MQDFRVKGRSFGEWEKLGCQKEYGEGNRSVGQFMDEVRETVEVEEHNKSILYFFIRGRRGNWSQNRGV